MRNNLLTGFWFLIVAGAAFGQVLPSTALDCLISPSTTATTGVQTDQLGRVSLILISCFEETELRLNNIMQPGLPPNREIDVALIALHKQLTQKTSMDLRQSIEVLVQQGTEENRKKLAQFEADVVQAMVLTEASLAVRALRTTPGDNETKDKGKEVQESIKKIIKELVDNKFTPSYIGKSFEIIDELVRLFVKT
jgi:hypothetical protein